MQRRPMSALAAIDRLVRAGRRAGPGLARLAGVALLALHEPTSDCVRLAASTRHVAVAATCEADFERSGDLLAARAALRAQLALGQPERAQVWLQRLQGTPLAGAGWRSMANYQLTRGAAAEAEQALRQALAADRAQADSAGEWESHSGLFYLAWRASRYRAAFVHLERALEVTSRSGLASQRARTALSLFSLLFDAGDTPRARQALEAARALYVEAQRGTPSWLSARWPLGARRALPPEIELPLLLNEGALLIEDGRPAWAREVYKRALEELSASASAQMLRAIHLNLVDVNLALGDVDQAEAGLAAARPQVDFDDPASCAAFGLRAARTAQARRHFRAARAAALAGLACDAPSIHRSDLEHQVGLSAEAEGHFDEARLAYERSASAAEELLTSISFDDFKDWLAAERRRPLEGLFLLQAQAGDRFSALDTLERAQGRAFLARLTDLAAQAPAAPEATLAALAEHGADRLVAVDALRDLAPRLASVPIARRSATGVLLSRLRQRHVRAYFKARDNVYLVQLDAGEIAIRRLALAADATMQLAARLVADFDDERAATALGEALWPEGSLPARGAPVHVIADDALGLDRVPFAALRRGGRYLVEDHPLAIAPSFNALCAPHQEAAGAAVVLGDPRGDLPAAAQEARDVAALLHTRPQIAAAARIGTLGAAAQARVLHVAAHSDDGPRGPFLALADGDLTADRLLRANLAPRLVVLASCASGLSGSRGQAASLAQAFLATGSAAVLASLRSIDDAQARRLVLDFYRAGGAQRPTLALAHLQRQRIAASERPTRWAAFAVFGDGL